MITLTEDPVLSKPFIYAFLTSRTENWQAFIFRSFNIVIVATISSSTVFLLVLNSSQLSILLPASRSHHYRTERPEVNKDNLKRTKMRSGCLSSQ